MAGEASCMEAFYARAWCKTPRTVADVHTGESIAGEAFMPWVT
jgi:hypothetical protein